jgi:hypothetical protein
MGTTAGAVFALVAICIALCCSKGAAQSRRFLIINQGPQRIEHLFISPASAANWGADLLTNPLSARQAQPIDTPGSFGCKVDVKASYEDGHNVIVRNHLICGPDVNIELAYG